MIKINLVPQAILDKERQKQRVVQIGIAGVLIFAVFAGVSFKHYYRGVVLAKELAEKEEKFEKLKKVVAQVEALEEQAAAVRGRLEVMRELDLARPLYPVFMTDLLSTFPKGVFLKSLTTTVAGADLEINMSAESLTPEDISGWLRTLSTAPKFSGPVIGALVLSPTGTVSFTMKVKYLPRAAGETKA